MSLILGSRPRDVVSNSYSEELRFGERRYRSGLPGSLYIAHTLIRFRGGWRCRIRNGERATITAFTTTGKAIAVPSSPIFNIQSMMRRISLHLIAVWALVRSRCYRLDLCASSI